jgi:TolB-like protein/DNA-binding winged helix-turn-helix (wHTH) protein/Tfp pilus assembly protein PilF
VAGDFQLGPWLVQPSLNSIAGANQSKRLEPKAMRVLVCLSNHAGEVVTKERLLAEVWPDTFVTDDVLLRCISELRKALEDDAREPRFIQTITKSGYRIIAAVTPAAAAAPQKNGHAEAAPGVSGRRLWVGALGAVTLLALLLGAGYLAWQRFRPSPAPERPATLAVLPFQNLSDDPEQEYFSDGLTEEMITQLAQLEPERLKVIARSTAMLYKQTAKTVDQIGRELNASYLLEGTVRREGQRVRITAQLIRVSDQIHTWADSYDRELGGILSAQAEVARSIAAQIRITLGAGAASHLAAARPVNPDAYVACLKGRFYMNKATREGFQKATELFQEAVRLDPAYAPAWMGLGNTYRFRGTWMGDMRPKEAFPEAKQMLARALDLDPRLGEAHSILGWVYFAYDWNWAAAETEFRRGIQLAPNSAGARTAYGNFLRCMKRFEEARLHIESGLELDPLDPLDLADASLLYYLMEQRDKAEKLALRAVEIEPTASLGNAALAQIYSSEGKVEKAIGVLEQERKLHQPDILSMFHLGRLYAQVGRKAEARSIVEALRASAVGPSLVANLYAVLGEKQAAIDWLKKGFEERDPYMPWLNLTIKTHPLWNEPGFQDILRRMNFPQ